MILFRCFFSKFWTDQNPDLETNAISWESSLLIISYNKAVRPHINNNPDDNNYRLDCVDM